MVNRGKRQTRGEQSSGGAGIIEAVTIGALSLDKLETLTAVS